MEGTRHSVLSAGHGIGHFEVVPGKCPMSDVDIRPCILLRWYTTLGKGKFHKKIPSCRPSEQMNNISKHHLEEKIWADIHSIFFYFAVIHKFD